MPTYLQRRQQRDAGRLWRGEFRFDDLPRSVLRRMPFLFLLIALLLARLPPTVAQEKVADPKRFEAAIAAFELADQTDPPPKNATLFIGASNVRLWKSLPERFATQKVMNRGFGGSHLSDVAFYVDRMVVPYEPKTIYLNAGGNDLHAGKSPAQVAHAFQEFVEKVRAALPQAQISYISIPTSPQRWSEVEQVKQANRMIAEFATKDGKIEFIDIFPLLLDSKGEPRPEFYVEDKLHFSERGYDVVTSAIRWQKAVRNLINNDRDQPPPENPVLFVGSSSIVRWKSLAEDFPDIAVLNRGFGGSEVFDSLNYVDRLVTPYRPRMVVMYAGGNDIHHGKTSDRVAADFREFVGRVHARLPETRIAYISIAGNPARWSEVERVKDANRQIEEFTKTDSRLIFINVFPHMMGSDGQPKPDIFVEDRLHMNENGYAIWKEVVGPFLKMP